jgi:hypothetical protein
MLLCLQIFIFTRPCMTCGYNRFANFRRSPPPTTAYERWKKHEEETKAKNARSSFEAKEERIRKDEIRENTEYHTPNNVFLYGIYFGCLG